MSERDLDSKLNSYLRDAHAMERNVHQMLISMIATTEDPEIKNVLEHHKSETERQIDRLAGRLDARGEDTSTMKDVGAVMGGFFKGLADNARSDKAGKNARDGFVTEALEIASYELLERLAERAGDAQTAQVARTNKAEEEAMREAINSNWDRFIDLVLEKKASLHTEAPGRWGPLAIRTRRPRTSGRSYRRRVDGRNSMTVMMRVSRGEFGIGPRESSRHPQKSDVEWDMRERQRD
jgi:ferritin-like metal-binding protein YciE